MYSINIAIFASGSGSNAQKICQYLLSKKYLKDFGIYKESFSIIPSLILTNKKDAYVLERAKNLKIKSHFFEHDELSNPSGKIAKLLKYNNIAYLILAGFLLKIPPYLVKNYSSKIINLHPSLLPKYGGKGMYGKKVHQSVIDSGDSHSGITIHLVDNNYDNGEHLFQITTPIDTNETPETLANKIHQLEWEHFPKVICSYILERETSQPPQTTKL